MRIDETSKEFKRQVDIIKGDELYIINILEKWGISNNDIINIQNKITTIKERTLELYISKTKHDDYIKKFGCGNKSLKSQGITHSNKRHKREYQVYKDGKFLMQDINARVCQKFGIDQGMLSRIKEKGKIKGYDIVAIEVEHESKI